jgi:flagellar basal-body rod protein FlgB
LNGLTLFDLAFKKNEWLAARQSAIASNIANVNTPGYRTRDIPDFERVMDEGTSLVVTHPGHIKVAADKVRPAATVETDSPDRLHSGNTVDLEKEFMKSGETMRSYSANVQVVKSFHRMMLATLKG